MFLHKCIVEFTPEVYQMIPLLNELGYKRAYERGTQGNFLVTDPDLDGYPCYYTTDECPVGNAIDCGDNYKLFCEVASMCDNSDKHQIFIIDRGCVFDDGKFYLKGDRIICLADELPHEFRAHKASLDELLKFYNN